MNKLNSFFSIFFIFFFLIFFSYIFVVIFIDPYDIFHQTKFEKINNKKYFHLEREYVHKEINLLRNNPNILLLGSSSSLIGFELHNYKNFKNKKVYNFGLSGVGPYEMNLYMSELIDNLDNLEKVIIGLDFFMFHNERVIRPQFYEFDYTNKFMNVFKLGRIILTKSCAKDTFLTLYKNMTDKTVSNEITFYGNLKSDLVYNSLLSKYGSNEEIFINFLKSDFNDSKNSLQNYNISDKELQNLDKLIKLLEENNIRYDLFLAPVHNIYLESLMKIGKRDEIKFLKKKLANFDKFHDFMNYSILTDEIISDSMNLYIDPVHFYPIVGNEILDNIFKKSSFKRKQDLDLEKRYLWLENDSVSSKIINKIF
jgi:hypothetical protein